ncbi:MAG: hypothetical protein ABIJ12_12840, partial [bacterium]
NIRRKLIGFQYYYKSKKIFNRNSNITGFQVLIVIPGKIEGDLKLSGRIANIHQELLTSRKLYTLKSLFLLTSPKSMSLQHPESVLSDIWISVKSPESLLSLIE